MGGCVELGKRYFLRGERGISSTGDVAEGACQRKCRYADSEDDRCEATGQCHQ
jgi:hypothetical protein